MQRESEKNNLPTNLPKKKKKENPRKTLSQQHGPANNSVNFQVHTENLMAISDCACLRRLPKNRREKSNSGQRYGDSKVGVGQRGEEIEHRLLPRNPTVIHSHGITELRK